MPIHIAYTHCTMDCPDTCGLEVTVVNGRIQKIRGTQQHPVTDGFICDKIARFDRRVYHENRLLYPLRRCGKKGAGQFTHISWDEAVAEITDRFKTIIQQWGGEAILPFALISPSNNKMISSTLGEFNYPELRLTIHPSDATARGIQDGDVVRIFNELGEVICRAQVSARLRAGMVSLPKGAWRISSRNGFTATALCPADVNEVGGGACFNDARVEVEKQS
jgi:anaerobic selenocysteine-containing dehydrogenase